MKSREDLERLCPEGSPIQNVDFDWEEVKKGLVEIAKSNCNPECPHNQNGCMLDEESDCIYWPEEE